MTAVPTPYRSTPVFDETTLPAGLRGEHSTKAGVWGVIRVLDGRLKLELLDDGSATILTPDNPGFIQPEQRHRVTPLGTVRMRVEFYSEPPG